MNNYIKPAFTYWKYSNRNLFDIKLISNKLIYEFPDEEYLFITDFVVCGIKPYSYLISNYGKIYSIDRDKYLQYQISSRGWARVALTRYNLKFGKAYVDDVTCSVHRLVAITFNFYYGTLPKNYIELEVNHIDGNKMNNYIGNLEFCTTLYNCYHRDNVIGHNIRTLSDKEVENICEIRAKFGYGRKRISQITGISENIIRNIIEGKTYKHITEKYFNDSEYIIYNNIDADFLSFCPANFDKELEFSNKMPAFSPSKFINKYYFDPNFISGLIFDHQDEFYLYISDINVPQIQPFTYLISNYGKVFNVAEHIYLRPFCFKNNILSVSLNKYLDGRSETNVQLKRLVKIEFSLYLNILPLDFLSRDVINIDKNFENNYFQNLKWNEPDTYKYRIMNNRRN